MKLKQQLRTIFNRYFSPVKKILLTAITLGAMLCACSVNEPTPAGTGAMAPEGALPGLFSVSKSQKVYFSQGNLQYQASTKTWRFAENQYDYIGKANAQISDTCSGWIDLFGWGTGNCPTKTVNDYETANTDYPSFVDWGNNPIANGGNEAGLWRTLTMEEWTYLFTKRANAKKLYGMADLYHGDALVPHTHGIIILPDDWTAPDSITFKPGTADGWGANYYKEAQWAAMEASGAVYLPAAGMRDGTDISYMRHKGFYWSSTPTPRGNRSAFFTEFEEDGSLVTKPGGSRFYGYSVRLVKDL